MVKLELTPEQAQYVLNVLQDQPHREVNVLINTIIEQANQPEDKGKGEEDE